MYNKQYKFAQLIIDEEQNTFYTSSVDEINIMNLNFRQRRQYFKQTDVEVHECVTPEAVEQISPLSLWVKSISINIEYHKGYRVASWDAGEYLKWQLLW